MPQHLQRPPTTTQLPREHPLAKNTCNISCWLNAHFLKVFLAKPDLVRAVGRTKNWEQPPCHSNTKYTPCFCAEVFAKHSGVTHNFPMKSPGVTGTSDVVCMFMCLYVHVEALFDSFQFHPSKEL